MMKYIAIPILLAAMAMPAFAQKKQENPAAAAEAAQRKKEAEAVDRQYKAALDRTKGTEEVTVNDPWRNMREGDVGKTHQQ